MRRRPVKLVERTPIVGRVYGGVRVDRVGPCDTSGPLALQAESLALRSVRDPWKDLDAADDRRRDRAWMWRVFALGAALGSWVAMAVHVVT